MRKTQRAARGMGMAALLLIAGCGKPAPASARRSLEERLAAAGRILLMVPYGVPADGAGRSIRFDRDTLCVTPLYLRHRDDSERYLFVAEDGSMVRDGVAAGAVAKGGELRIDAAGQTLLLDGRVALADLSDWEVFWAGMEEKQPQVQDASYPAIEFSDGFMRHELASDLCQIASGPWALCQRGGGMPKNEGEARSYSVQRAVNPFSVGCSDGVLSFGREDWNGYLGEVNAYFGVPVQDKVTDCRTVPSDRDMLVAIGGLQGFQVGFGWFGVDSGFALATREGSGPWRVVARYEGDRPPLTNWLRLGIGVRRGCFAEAWLDGRVLLRHELPQQVAGRFHLVSRGGATEWDDVRVRTYPLAEAPWTPIRVSSKSFSKKQKKNNADGRQYSGWSKGLDAFKIGLQRDPELGTLKQLTTLWPLIGDWQYESVPYSSQLGAFVPGSYRFEVLAEAADRPGTAETRVVATLDATRDDSGWLVPARAGAPELRVSGKLLFRRTAADGWRLAVRQRTGWAAVSAPAPGPVFLRVNRVPTSRTKSVSFPRSGHHVVRCRNLTSDLFESAPAAWSWIEGHSRMAARWACQDQWNFLACSGPGVPFMVSKRRFSGTQTHEYFMSMRPVTPNDAGDASFRYDPTEDNGLEVFKEHDGWYNRRDLNFSFCSDGRNPLSGYAVVFGGDDNTVTRFYRRGKILAETERRTFLFPPGPDRNNIHWRWWKFSVHKRGRRIRVLMDGREMFDVVDPKPLSGGHVGFWTVRNGFSLAKVSSVADSVTWAPDVLYVAQDKGQSGWQPVITDALTLAPAGGGMTRVRLTTGCGVHALRYVFKTPVPLSASPQFRLSLRISKTVAVNAFLETSVGDLLLDLGAGMEGMKAFATPSNERGECFQLPTMSQADVEKQSLAVERRDGQVVCDVQAELAKRGIWAEDITVLSLTLGQTSNTDYALAAGDGRNLAGATYEVGEPVFGPRSRGEKEDRGHE